MRKMQLLGMTVLMLISLWVPSGALQAAEQQAIEMMRTQVINEHEGDGGELRQQFETRVQHWVDSLPPASNTSEIAVRTSQTSSQTPDKAVQFVCLPTCDETDGRMLSLAGPNINAVNVQRVLLSLAVPSTASGLSFGVFDGDSTNTWDGGSAIGLVFNLYADPLGDGSGTLLLNSWLGTTMPDNAWFDVALSNSPSAESPSGNYLYVLEILLPAPAGTAWSNFKVRVAGTVAAPTTIFPVAIAYTAPLFSGREGLIVYPNAGAGDITTTTYDGSWNFFLDGFGGEDSFEYWDGDADRGSVGDLSLDTDDPNTPALLGGSAFLPPWAIGTAARPEGVAFVVTCSTERSLTSCPADDRSPGIFLRAPSIRYDLVTPDGQVYPNDNPSGQLEWERFLVNTAPFDPTEVDYQAPSLGSGIYLVRAEGVDLGNLNAFKFFNDVLGVCADGSVCYEVLRPYALGDRVWLDANGDGVQDVDEVGISGVVLELLTASGKLIASATTDAEGLYRFEVETGDYSVRVAASNFAPGGALVDFEATTLDELSTSVTDSNDLGLDFGYAGSGSIGDLVWYDANGDGIFNEGSGSGIGGVQVTLTAAGEDGLLGTADDVFVASTTTADDGSYLFDSLSPDNYRVEIDAATLPTGQVLTTSGSVDVLLASGDEVTDADFGARVATGQGGTIGDLVWLDLNANGLLDEGESGFNGVTVWLAIDVDGDGEAELTATTITSTLGGQAGSYFFFDVPAGVATVTVDSSTLPAGAIQTYDADGTASANKATASVPDKASVLTFDFGYRGTASLNGLVWYDIDANGDIDAGEPGFENVTVDLLDSNGDVVASTTTDASGAYRFDNLLPGTYTVRIDTTTLPDNVSQTFEQDGTLTGTITLPLGVGQSAVNLIFGYTRVFPVGNSCMGSAEADQYGGSGGHSVWMPGIATDLVFEPFAGSLIEHGDGTATLSGVARSAHDEDKAFEVTVTLSDYRQTAPAGSPKKELNSSAYVQNGGPVDPATWYYYNAFSGTFIGVGDWEGAVVKVELVGAAFQFGVGANGKNVNDGASAWFTWQVTRQPDHGAWLQNIGQGDFNLDFVSCLGFCERSTGYWRNHTDAWPTYSLEIGGVVYGFDDLYDFVTYGGRDATLKLARQLVGAKLNLAARADASIQSVADEADAFLADYPPGSNPKGSVKGQANSIKDQLDDYNTGATCEGFYTLDSVLFNLETNGGDAVNISQP